MNLSANLNKALGRLGLRLVRHDAWRRAHLLRRYNVDLVIDVGAADGAYGRELRRFGYTGRLLSFEPLDEAYTRLTRAAARDPLWETVKCALGDSDRRATINVAENGNSSSILEMLPSHIRAAPHASYVGEQSISVMRLDPIVEQKLATHQATFLKLDTQGYERYVLDGAEKTIESAVGVQIELSLVPLYESGMLFDEAIAYMQARGYRLHAIEPGFRDSTRHQLLQADGIFFRD